MAADERKVTLHRLLDMTTAFYCVNHQRLQGTVGIGDTALDWIRLFLSGHTQQVVYGGEQSVTLAFYRARYCKSSTRLHCSNSSRSIRATLINTPTKLRSSLLTIMMRTCLVYIEAWLKAESQPVQTDLTWAKLRLCGSSQVSAAVGQGAAWWSSSAVISSQGHRYWEKPRRRSQLLMSAHVAAVYRGSCYKLRQLWPLKRCMADEANKTLTHAFIGSQLDNCNALYCCIYWLPG